MIDAIGIGIVFPIMPDLMARVGAGDLAQGSIWAGVLMAAYAGAQFLFAPVVGSLSDAFGRRPVLLLALAMLALDYVIMALAGTLWLLILGRTLAGLAGATYITATAYVADISSPGDRAARFGLIGAAFGIGFVIGPALGGVAATWGVSAPFWVAAGLSALNFAFGLFILPESLKRENRRPFGARDLNPFATIVSAFRVPGLAIPLICIAVFEFANMVYPTLWAFWGREVFGWSTLVIGLTLSAYGICMVVAQAVVMPLRCGAPGGGAPDAHGAGARGRDLRGLRRRRSDMAGACHSADGRADRSRAADADGDVGQHGGRGPAGHGAGRHRFAVIAVGGARAAGLHADVRAVHLGRVLGRLPAGRAIPVLRRAFSLRPSCRCDQDAARSAPPHAVRIEPLVDRHQRRRVEER
jgi:multidrug resistance protein